VESAAKMSLLRVEGKSACSFKGRMGPGSVEHCAPEADVKFQFAFPQNHTVYCS